MLNPGTLTTLSATGRIFDDETWTRAQFFGSATAQPDNSASADSILTGKYGALDVAQNGTWTYMLNNGLAATQALPAGATAHDVFTVTDNNDVSQVVSITVNGTNDAPVLHLHNGGEVWTVPQTPVDLAPSLTLTDVDSSTLDHAAIQITGGYDQNNDIT